jgi:hypothetical protein
MRKCPLYLDLQQLPAFYGGRLLIGDKIDNLIAARPSGPRHWPVGKIIANGVLPFAQTIN